MNTISKGLPDEVFVVGSYGLRIQVHGLIDWINNSPNVDAVWCSTDDLLRLRRSDRVQAAVVASMPDHRRDEPVLLCQLLEEWWVIDGNHRLEKRRRDSLAQTLAVPVPPDVIAGFLEELGF